MHPLLRAAAERRLGLVTAVDARRAGYGHPEVRRLCASGAWVRSRRGVYAPAEHLAGLTGAARHRVDCLAVLLELGRPETTVSHTSAARLHGLPVRRGIEATVRLTDPAVWRRGRGFRMNRAPLPPEDVVDGGPLRLTSAPRTLVDCAREWDLEDGVVAVDAALLAGRTTVEQLRGAVETARSWPGGLTAARALALADGLVTYTDPWRGRSPERVLWEEKRREDELRALDIRVLRIADPDVDADRWPGVEARLRALLAAPAPPERRFRALARQRGRLRAG